MSHRIEQNENYYTANLEPEEDDTKLLSWWAMKMSPTFYSPFNVQLTKRVINTVGAAKKDSLYFTFVRDTQGKLGEINLDLKEETQEVWPYLPSTIPSAEQFAPGRKLFGILFLSREWIKSKQQEIDAANLGIDLESLSEDGKWPIGAAGGYPDYEELRSLIERLQDANEREALRASLDQVFSRKTGSQPR